MTDDRSANPPPRPFLGVRLKCCNVYVRAYLAADSAAYVAWCPRCATQVRIPVVAEGGSSERFFEAG